ncbi:MAG: hypothetical protein HOV67_07265 [Kribbellaceae bacterium]|nr:hypothetical protein [Kribbellaceae bacterium]
MAVHTKAELLAVIRRAYGPDVAESVAGGLPDQLDPERDEDAMLLARLGITREGLANALGGEI